ncbi:hypothetical protein EV363DRAFT_1370692 [Boletus edulis]|nr:hypothetical protein EV363DRAFT_1370692 [Boletus edulis]
MLYMTAGPTFKSRIPDANPPNSAIVWWQFLWGFWREHLLHELLWCVDEPTGGGPVTKQYLALMWSWVGIEGRVMMANWSAERKTWMVEVVNGSQIEGQGRVHLKGMVRQVWLMADEGRLSPRKEAVAPSGRKWTRELQSQGFIMLVTQLAQGLNELARLEVFRRRQQFISRERSGSSQRHEKDHDTR